MLHGRWSSEEDWIACRPPAAWDRAELSFASGMSLADDIANSSLSIDMATLSSRQDSLAARVRLAVSFRDLSDQYSEHGIGLVNGHVEGSLVC